MTTILASGDNHLGKALKKRKILREMGINNFLKLPKIAKKENAEYVVFPGDVFDKESSDIQSYQAYVQTLTLLDKNPMIKKIFIITGNHDQYNSYFSAASVDLGSLLESKKIIVCNNEYLLHYEESSNLLFFLLPYSNKLFLENEVGTKVIMDKINEAILEISKNETYRNAFKIFVSHFAIKEWMPFSSETISMEDLRAGNIFDLILLSDLHNETFENYQEGAPIIYTGSTMHTTITDLHKHKNGCKIIEIDNETKGVISAFKEVYTPKTIIVTTENLEEVKDSINSDSIIITDNLNIHNIYKDNVLYSMYKPTATTVTEAVEESDEDLETLDVEELSLRKINSDESLNQETKNLLIWLVTLDPESCTKKELGELVNNKIMENMTI